MSSILIITKLKHPLYGEGFPPARLLPSARGRAGEKKPSSQPSGMLGTQARPSPAPHDPVPNFKSLLMPLFLMGCFPVDFQEVKRPLRTKSVKRPIKVGKRPINEGKRPIKAKVLVGVSVGSLMGCFRAPPPWRKTAPLKRPIKRSMITSGYRRQLRSQIQIPRFVI